MLTYIRKGADPFVDATDPEPSHDHDRPLAFAY